MKFIGIALFFFTVCLAQADLLISGINFGDGRDDVTKKLQKSQVVKSEVPPTMLTRVGLNGSFKTVNALKGKKFLLYFNWSDADSLDELTFRSTAYNTASYNTQLKSLWNSAIQLLSSIHGKTQNAGEYPNASLLKNGGIRFSHEWQTNDGFIYLGTGKENGEVHLIITFSKEKMT